jgi:tape measure domain-containing protein
VSVVANVAINVDSRNAVSKLRQVQTQATATEKAFGGVASAVGKLAVAFSAIQAARFVFVKAAELESQTRSLQVLTGSAEKAKQIIQELQQLGAVTPFTSTELIDSAKRLQAFGVEADKVVETTKRLADVSGATGAELSGLVTAYGQVQAKGRLQGEELLQFQERGVALQAELRKMYGLSGEEFQKALEKGRIGAEAVEVAILRLTSAGGKYANGAIAQSDTLQGKLSTLQDSFEQLARNIGTFFTPVFKFLIDGIDAFLQRLNNAQRLGAEARAYQEANVRTRNRFGLRAANPFDTEVSQYRERLRRSLVSSEMGAGRGAAPSTPTPSMVPALLGADATGRKKGKTDAERAAEKAAREAERLAGQTAQQLKSAQDLKFEQQNRLALLRSENEYAKAFTGFSIQRLEIQRRYNELLGQSKSAEETTALQQARAAEYKQSSLQLQQQINELLKQGQSPLNDAVESIKNQAAFEREYGDLIKNGTNPELAKQIIEIRKAYDESVKLLEPALAAARAAVTKAEAEGASATEIQKYREELEKIEAIRKGLESKKSEGESAAIELNKPKTDRERLQAEADAVKKELEKLTDPINLVTTAAAGIGDAFAASFKGVISGSMSAREALAGFFQSVADQFLDMAAQIIAKWIQMTILNTVLQLFPGGSMAGGGLSGGSAGFGGNNTFGSFDAGGGFAYGGGLNLLPGRANGGPVSGGQMYMVGERGPELFVPGRSGTIVPNDQMGGGGEVNVVVNVDAKGSNVAGNDQDANQLGRVISAAVQSELIKQQRPGGLLTR